MREAFGDAGRSPSHVPCQLCHRVASTICEIDRFNAGAGAMIVHSFFPEGEDEEKGGFDRFAVFCAFLGRTDAEKSTPMWARLSIGRDLLLGWAKGDPKYLWQALS